MKITIYSSGGDNPLWTIVKSEMTQKEAENEVSDASMMMTAAREARFKIKEEDPNQLKLNFDTNKIVEKKKMILRNQQADPYYGSDVDMRCFLQDLDRQFEKQWIHVDDDRVLDLLEMHGKSMSTMTHKLRVLEERGHCKLKCRGKLLRQFYLEFI